MNAPNTARRLRRYEPALPDVAINAPGSRFASRAVRLTLLVLFVLMAGVAIAISVIRIDAVLDGPGTLEPIDVWIVRAPEAGLLQTILVRAGDTVRAGQLVARLDTLSLGTERSRLVSDQTAARVTLARLTEQPAIDSARIAANIAVIDANLMRARAVLRERMTAFTHGGDLDSLLRASTPGTHVMLDEAVADVRAAESERRARAADLAALSLGAYDAEKQRASLRSTSAQLAAVDERLRRLQLVAPASGVVLTEDLERQSGRLVRDGDPIVEIAERRRWRIVVSLPEQSAYQINVGDPVKLELHALSADGHLDLLHGRVTSVALDAQGGTSTVGALSDARYRVAAEVDSASLTTFERSRLKRGYTADAKIVTKHDRIIRLLWQRVVAKLPKH